MRTTRKGFTLIEILIVVIILGILAAIVIPNFSSASSDARHSALASTVQSLRTQVEAYRIQHKDKLPPPDQFWTLLTSVTDSDGNMPPAAGETRQPAAPEQPDDSAEACPFTRPGSSKARAGKSAGHLAAAVVLVFAAGTAARSTYSCGRHASAR